MTKNRNSVLKYRKWLVDGYLLFKTLIYYPTAFLVARVQTKRSQYYVLGSGYGDHCDDNIKALLHYCADNGRAAYFITNKPTLRCHFKRGSFYSFIRYFQCAGVMYSHSISDIIPNLQYLPWMLKYIPKPTAIFVQHGVSGLKTDNNWQIYMHRLQSGFDYMLCATRIEREVIQRLAGVAKDKIKLSGMPRFDSLHTACHRYNNILVFLTWGEVQLYQASLTSIQHACDALKLAEQDYKIDIISHPMMAGMAVVTQPPSMIKTCIDRCGLLITDCSSIAWDFFYRGLPVIFFQPPNHQYPAIRRLIAPFCANNESGLKQLLARYQQHDLTVPKINWAYHDTDNCQRAIALLERRC